MGEIIKPNVTGEYYRPGDAVRIVNHAQANFYLSRGVPLLDIYVSQGMTVYVSHKRSSYESFKLWRERKQENEATHNE